MKTIPKIGLAAIRDGKLLIVRNKNTTKFLMPGGQPEKGEASLETLKREIKEELNCVIDTKKIKKLGEFSDLAANNPGCVVKMEVYIGNIIGEIYPSNEIAEFKWFDPKHDNIEILSDIIKNHILPDLMNKKYL